MAKETLSRETSANPPSVTRPALPANVQYFRLLHFHWGVGVDAYRYTEQRRAC